jgi:hypothetical protein
LAKDKFIGASPEMRAELLEYLDHDDVPYAMKAKKKDWSKVEAELDQLRNATPPDTAPNNPLQSDQTSGAGK